MRGILSLDQELRAIRKGRGQESAPRSNRPADLKQTERPWQPDIDQLHQTMRELLRAVAGFSGVELPGLPSGLQDNDAPPPRLDIKNLKDRFRNDLEGFSIRTTEELTKRAREQTRSALEAVQNEVGGMVDQVAAEFRENLQLPAQIEKLLEPCVEDAEARLANSISEKFESLVARHEQLVQEKIQGTISSLQAQMSALEQTVQEVRMLKAESVSQASAEQPSTAEVAGRIDELAAKVQEKLQDQAQVEKLFEPRVEEATSRLEKSVSQKVEHLIAQHEQMVQAKLQVTLSSVEAQMSVLEQTLQEVRKLKAEPVAQGSAEPRNTAADVERVLAEHDRLVQGRLQEALKPVQAQMSAMEHMVQVIREMKAEPVAQPSTELPSTAEVAGRIDQLAAEFNKKLHDQAQIERLLEPRVGEATARLEKSICQKVENLVTQHEQLVQDKLQGTLSSVQEQISALEQAVQQIRELRVESVSKLPVEQPVAAADNATKKDEDNLNLDFNGFLDQAFSRIECSFDNLREARKGQSAQNGSASLEYLRQAIPTGSTDMLLRVQQALDNLDRLGTKDPQPAS